MFKLTNADKKAIENLDFAFLGMKGADFYNDEDYEKAIEYYRLASAMGDDIAIGNLGYCYLYGNGTKKNVDLAIAYLKIAADSENINSIYKLGNIYELGEDVEQDEELARYYYEKAMKAFEEAPDDIKPRIVYDCPSLFLALGRGMMPDGILHEDIMGAYNYLRLALMGFNLCLDDGESYYADHVSETIDLLDDPIFDEIKEDEERKEAECDRECDCQHRD